MELTLESIKEATKQGYLEAMFEYEQYKKEKKRGIDPDMISINQAGKIRPKSRVYALIDHGLLKVISTGSANNSTKYVSKKRLLELDNVIL